MTAEQDGGAGGLRRRLGLEPPFDSLAIGWLLWTVCLATALSSASRSGFQGTQAWFLVREDLPVFLAEAAVAVALAWAPAAWMLRLGRMRRRAPAPVWVGLLAAACVVAGVVGFRLVFQGYLLSLDEFLADFDARIFARGELMAPVAAAWREYVPALQPIYMLPVPSHDMWASGYLPAHAAMRAAARTLGAGALLNPLLSALAVVAIYGVARRLWPQRPAMALGAAALLASSSQLVVTAMTAYAMPAHLALNLVWLWLFLRGGKLGHGAAMAVGFLAAGLHQLIFHPLFAAPFVLQLWLDRRWRLAGAYTIAYAAICGFWIEYWQLELGWLGEARGAAASVGGGWFMARLGAFLATIQPGNLGAMAASLVRFAAWQNPLAPPLFLVGAGAALRAKGHLRALLAGVVLMLAIVTLVVPSQTQGWGYRYLHQLLGSVCLIAVWTWTRLTDALPAPRRAAAAGAFAAACAVSLLLLAPLHAWQAWAYVRPYAAADALVRQAPEPVVLVDNNRPWFDMGAVVRNDPFLSRGPKVMLLAALTADQVRALCAQGQVGLFDGRQARALGVDTVDVPPDPHAVALRRQMAALSCGRPLS
ncbi:MAG TPA: hypothetical protein VGG29_14945 [Caulobacteraceae bacterium]|jgi:hypothetical protein